VRAGGGKRVPAERRFGKGRVGRSSGAANRRSGLLRRTLRSPLSVLGERGNFLPFRNRTPKDGIIAARTAIDSTDCRRTNEQGNRESLLPLGTDGEKPSLPDEAQNWRRGPPGHRAGLPNARIHAVKRSELLVSQGNNRVELHRSPRWDVARRKGDQHKQSRHSGERQRVVRTDLIEQAR